MVAKRLWLGIGIAALAIPIAIALTQASLLQAQSITPASAHFDVASVKLSKNPSPGGNVEITPGRFRGTDLAVQWLILVSYGIKSGNLTGVLPKWTIDERYTIEGTMSKPVSDDQVLSALRDLLKERFQLREHRETKQEPVYFLTVAKSGSKMPTGTCVPVKKDYPNECWSQGSEGLARTLDWRGTQISDAGGPAYRTLAGQLSLIVGRPVIDRTGLTGAFDVHLRWTSDPPSAAVAMPAPLEPSTAPSIADALETQLGLKLQPGRGPVEYLVVDDVQKPTEN